VITAIRVKKVSGSQSLGQARGLAGGWERAGRFFGSPGGSTSLGSRGRTVACANTLAGAGYSGLCLQSQILKKQRSGGSQFETSPWQIVLETLS
jgi:hypothetical protein